MSDPKIYWFRRKRYGYGWVPATWQGWAILGVYALILIALGSSIDANSPPNEVAFLFVLPAILLACSLVVICHKTGEKPRWQWGNRKEGGKLQ